MSPREIIIKMLIFQKLLEVRGPYFRCFLITIMDNRASRLRYIGQRTQCNRTMYSKKTIKQSNNHFNFHNVCAKPIQNQCFFSIVVPGVSKYCNVSGRRGRKVQKIFFSIRNHKKIRGSSRPQYIFDQSSQGSQNLVQPLPLQKKKTLTKTPYFVLFKRS